MTVHLFGAVSSPSIANFALRKTARDNASNFHPEGNKHNHGADVDDCLISMLTELEAMELISNLTEVCHTASFHLSKWISNSRAVLGAVP